MVLRAPFLVFEVTDMSDGKAKIDKKFELVRQISELADGVTLEYVTYEFRNGRILIESQADRRSPS